MTDDRYNPPAFPHDNQELGDRHRIAQPGMTLRDYFAGQALAGLCANSGGPFQASDQSGWAMVNCEPADVARAAYILADAMLQARKNT